jgi:hypothetical protein
VQAIGLFILIRLSYLGWLGLTAQDWSNKSCLLWLAGKDWLGLVVGLVWFCSVWWFDWGERFYFFDYLVLFGWLIRLAERSSLCSTGWFCLVVWV